MDGRRFDGQEARRLRRLAGMKMITMSEEACISYGHLRMAETAGRDISDEMAHRIRQVLSEKLGREVTIEELTHPTDGPTRVVWKR